MNTPDQDLEQWIQHRKDLALDQEASPFFERKVLSRIQDVTPQKKQPQKETTFTLPKPLTSSVCITIGLLKFFFILHLPY